MFVSALAEAALQSALSRGFACTSLISAIRTEMKDIETQMKEVDRALRGYEDLQRRAEAERDLSREQASTSGDARDTSHATDEDNEDEEEEEDEAAITSAEPSPPLLSSPSTCQTPPYQLLHTIPSLLNRQALLSHYAARLWDRRSRLQAQWARVEEVREGKGIPAVLKELSKVGAAGEKAREKLWEELVLLVVLRGQV